MVTVMCFRLALLVHDTITIIYCIIPQLWPDEIDDTSSSSLDIDIHWSVNDGQMRPTHDTFRVHILGIERPFGIPITVPQPYRSTLTSEVGSIITDGKTFT